VGFGMGMERVLLVAAKETAAAPEADIYVAAISDQERGAAFDLLRRIREAGLSAEMDYERKSFKAQMRTANRIGARFAVILGEDEVKSGKATVKNLKDGLARSIPDFESADPSYKRQETIPMAEVPEYLKNGLSRLVKQVR